MVASVFEPGRRVASVEQQSGLVQGLVVAVPLSIAFWTALAFLLT